MEFCLELSIRAKRVWFSTFSFLNGTSISLPHSNVFCVINFSSAESIRSHRATYVRRSPQLQSSIFHLKLMEGWHKCTIGLHFIAWKEEREREKKKTGPHHHQQRVIKDITACAVLNGQMDLDFHNVCAFLFASGRQQNCGRFY